MFVILLLKLGLRLDSSRKSPGGDLMAVSMIYVISYALASVVTFIISVYFFREYSAKRLRASLAWAIGLLTYGFVQLSHLTSAVVGEISMGRVGF